MNREFEKSIYEYMRSIEGMMEAVEKHPGYPFEPSLGQSQQILEHIHRQMNLIEGIRVPKKEKETSEEVNVENNIEIKSKNVEEKTEGKKKGKRKKKIKKENESVLYSNNPPPPPWKPKK